MLYILYFTSIQHFTPSPAVVSEDCHHVDNIYEDMELHSTPLRTDTLSSSEAINGLCVIESGQGSVEQPSAIEVGHRLSSYGSNRGRRFCHKCGVSLNKDRPTQFRTVVVQFSLASSIDDLPPNHFQIQLFLVCACNSTMIAMRNLTPTVEHDCRLVLQEG